MMEIVVRSRSHPGYGLDALENQIRDTLGDAGRITGGGGGLDGWHLYVELCRDTAEADLSLFVASLATLNVPDGTFIQHTAPDGTAKTIQIRAEQTNPAYRRWRGSG